MQECRFYAGARFEISPPASNLPPPPSDWITPTVKTKQFFKEDIKPSFPAQTVVRKNGKFLASGLKQIKSQE